MGFLIGCIGAVIIIVVLAFIGAAILAIAIYALAAFAIVKGMENGYYFYTDKPFEMLWICAGIFAVFVIIAMFIGGRNKNIRDDKSNQIEDE